MASVSSAQDFTESFAKGSTLLLAEEFRQAEFFLRESARIASSKKQREDAEFSLAECYLLENQFDSAQTILDRHQKTKRIDDASFLKALQKFQENKSDALTAFYLVSQTLPKDRIQLIAKTHYYLGVLEFRKRGAVSISRSIEFLQKSIKLFAFDSVQSHIKISLSRLQLADAFRIDDKIEAALNELKLAIKIFEASPYAKPAYLATAFGVEGKIYTAQGKYYKAKTAFEKSLALQFKSGADSASIGVTFSNLGRCFGELHDQNNCEKAYDQVNRYWQHVKNQPNRLIQFANNKALFLHEIYESGSAIESLEKILPLIESGNTVSKFLTYYNLAVIYYDLAEYSNGEKYFGLLENLFQQNHDELSTSQEVKWKQLKAMYLLKNNENKAALSICKSIDSQRDSLGLSDTELANFYFLYADMLMSTDSFQRSKDFLHKANRLYSSQVNDHRKIEINNSMAMNYFHLNKLDSTLFYATRALQSNSIPQPELVYPFKYPQEAIQACYIILAFYLRQYQKKPSSEIIKKMDAYELLGINLIRSIRKNLYSDADRLAYGKSVAAFYQVLQHLYYLRWQSKDPSALNKFFEYAEESKFQALSNSLSNARVNSFKEVSAALVREERLLAKEKVLENNQLVQLLGSSPDEEEIEERKTVSRNRLIDLEKKHNGFLDSLQSSFRGYYELKYGGVPITLSKLQDELSQQQVVLQFKVVDSLVMIQVIHKSYVSLFRLGNAATIHKLIRKVRNMIYFKLENDFSLTSHELYNQLLFPVMEDLRGKKIKISQLIIIPDDFFYRLPFEALVTKTEPTNYLIQSYEIAYAYSCNLMIQTKRQPIDYPSASFLGIAPSFNKSSDGWASVRSTAAVSSSIRYDEFGFEPLKENETEINLIGDLSKGATNKILLSRNAATEEQFKRLDLKKFKYIHFATHGFVDVFRSGLSGLALTNTGPNEDNVLFSSEIYNLNLRADLVCLSACETGLGQNTAGEGLVGMGRAFFYAGARNLAVSLWRVSDKSTSLFMIDFYKNIYGQQRSLSASLREAKLKMIKSIDYKSPYYWAPFILVGTP